MLNRLRDYRDAKGWSQGELARRLGVSRQTINAVETDKYDPSLPLAFSIAKLFELGPAQYTPGTKMPEQHLTKAADREALVRFLERATAPAPGSKDGVPP